ncbi:phycobilisome linker polypeptide [filamentous cyanobacterium CCP2]|nr:phycobilisome linker polypeptide [filamentous cyanobacterium CCP2]
MFGQTAVGSSANTPSGSRMFRYEVVGLRQNNQTDRNNYSIRRSGSVFITVPYNRMNEEMQRILRMGGKIVNIEPLGNEVSNGAGKSAE